MNLWQRMKIAGRVLTRGADDDMPDGIKPPARASVCDPLSLSTVFRGVQVLQTAITGLPIHEMRGGVTLDASSIDIVKDHSQYAFFCSSLRDKEVSGKHFLPLVGSILDKQIVDLDGRKVVRVNDLRLAVVSAGVFLIDGEGRLRGLSPYGQPVADLAADLATLAREALPARHHP